MEEKFLIFDNVASKSYLKFLVDEILNYNWKYLSNLTYDDDYENVNNISLEYGFGGILNIEQKKFILPLILQICDLSGIEISNLNQIKRIIPRFQMMLSANNHVNDIHIDEINEHYVILFYPHNVDGETILYKETTLDIDYHTFKKMSVEERKNNLNILCKVKPIENRVLVFNGNRYHASSSPSKNPRCVVNINISPQNKNKMSLM